MLFSARNSRGCLVHLIAAFFFWKCSICSAQPLTNVKGYSADQQGLLYLRNAIPNFVWYQQTVPCTGWDEEPVGADDICTWDGVGCNAALQVVSIKFPNNASLLEGNIGDIMYGASLIPNLRVLYLANQTFNGMLPSNNFAMPVLEELDLSNNHIKGSLPGSWGNFLTFPKLRKFNAAFNNDLGGTLPATWGSDGSSMQLLNDLEINNCDLTGTLPAQWGKGLPALQRINLSSNLLTGTLPPPWSSLNLTVINLDRNFLNGSIPLAWGSNGTFKSLTELHLYSNLLTGTLPAAWQAPGTMPALMMMDVANNNFSGTVPGGWGSANSVFITQDNMFCGPMPPFNVFNCGLLRGSCIKGDGIYPTCPAPAPAFQRTSNSTSTSPVDKAALLRFKAAFPNFDISIRHRRMRWDPDTPMCYSWHGVTCWPDGYVRTIDLSVLERAPRIITPLNLPADNTSLVHASVPHQLTGNISDVLMAASNLTRLTKLDITNNDLTGYLPENLSFPWLEELKLVSNNIQGTVPESWGAAGSFPALRLLALDLNWRVTGPLPQTWGSSSTSMRKLEVVSLARCNHTGPLQTSWVKNLPILSVIDVSYNQLSGTLPQAMQGMQALGSLSLVGNGFNGTLPEQLNSSGGVRAWPFLQGLHLDHNLFSGPLPASWGGNGGMTSLRNLSATFNYLTGSIPAAWADANGKHRFPALKSLVLQPGNMGLCGSIPAGITVTQWLGGPDVSQVDNYGNKTCYSAAASSAVSSTPSTSSAATSSAGASVGTGAIVGIVVGLCVLLALVGGLLWLFAARRRQKRAQEMPPLHMLPAHKQFSQDGKVAAIMQIDEPPQHDSDSMIPPNGDHAPHSYVPFKQAPSSSASLPLTSPTSASMQGSGDSRSSGEDLTLFSMAGLKDWELDLDALEVELNEQGEEVELGHGAFGVVVKGTYRLAPVAIKRLKDQSPEQQRAFLKEMSILRACRGSRYIIPFVGASLLPGNTILAMDFMDNGNLWDALPRIGRNGRHIFQWHQRGKKAAYEIALGLHFLHELRVIHLDLKSSNVLIAADGTAKIADVGLSAQLQGHSHLSSMTVAGTWAWVAPEVIMAGKVTSKADIFSFGVVLWEIITVERPAWRGNLREIRVPEEAPEEIADLVLRCTGQPEERPSAADCADIIGRHLGAGSLPHARSGDGSTPRRGNFRRASSSDDPKPPPADAAV